MRDIRSVMWRAITACGIAVLAAGTSAAEVNPTPMAIPAIGTQGQASLYPSRIVMTPIQRGLTTVLGVKLFKVTHPCPRELAILLVNGNVKELLMANAGGCQPMQGTDLSFISTHTSFEKRLPQDPAPGLPPIGASRVVEPSIYSPIPVFPNAPPGPYGQNGPGGSAEGAWDLYVLDMGGPGRGVIAGAWGITTSSNVISSQTATITVPRTLADARAVQFPFILDLTNVRPDVRVRHENLLVVFETKHPMLSDLQVVLQSPSGTTVALLANAGGMTAFGQEFGLAVLNFTEQFFDSSIFVPPTGPIRSGSYRPTAYDSFVLRAPGPPGPYLTSLAAFDGEPLAGQWKALGAGQECALLERDTNQRVHALQRRSDVDPAALVHDRSLRGDDRSAVRAD